MILLFEKILACSLMVSQIYLIYYFVLTMLKKKDKKKLLIVLLWYLVSLSYFVFKLFVFKNGNEFSLNLVLYIHCGLLVCIYLFNLAGIKEMWKTRTKVF